MFEGGELEGGGYSSPLGISKLFHQGHSFLEESRFGFYGCLVLALGFAQTVEGFI